MSPLVSVVIPTCKRPNLLIRCLEALDRQQLPGHLFEVVVCDDGVDPHLEQEISRRARWSRFDLHYIAIHHPQGPAAARNRGADYSRGSILAFTDDDCVPQPYWLPNALPLFEKGAEVIAGKVVVPVGSRPTDYELNESGLARAEFVTANVVIRRDLFLSVGGFNESFAAAWREDSDLHFKLLNQGANIIKASDVVIVHPVRQAHYGISLKQQRKSQYDALLFKLHPQLYREKVGRFAPLPYYTFLVGLFVALLGFVDPLCVPLGAFIVLFSWLVIFIKRTLPTTKRLPHLVEMSVTSALLPLVSLYWRLVGALKFRVLFF